MTANPSMTAAPVSGRWIYLGPVVSGLCFVHCIGLALFAPILPGAIALLLGVTWLEPCLWLVSMAGTAVSLRRAQGRPRHALAVWALAAAAGVLGFAMDADRLVQISLGTSVAIQLLLVVRRWRNHRGSCRTADCPGCQQARGWQ